MRRKSLAAAVGLAVTLAAGAALPAAPVPPGAGKPETPADLKGLHALIGKAVEGGKRPTAEDVKAVKVTLQKVLDRVTRAGGLKERKLPVDPVLLRRADVVKTVDGSVENTLLVAGEVRGEDATNAVLLATGDVKFTGVKNSVVVGKTVRFNEAEGNVLVIADEVIRGTQARRTAGDLGPVLVAGQGIQLTRGMGAVCHVLRPGGGIPKQGRLPPIKRPIQMTRAENVLFLNEPDDVMLNRSVGSTTAPPKTPIAK